MFLKHKQFLSSNNFLIILIVFLLIILLYNNSPNSNEIKINLIHPKSLGIDEEKSRRSTIYVSGINISLEEANEKVFKKFGYEIENWTLPVPSLKLQNELQCEEIFNDWIKISEKEQPSLPPEQIPDDIYNEFTLNRYSVVKYKYLNEKNTGNTGYPNDWSILRDFEKKDLETLSTSHYTEGASVLEAMKHHSLNGLKGLVVGSVDPWVEMLALKHGAWNILTVEYADIQIPEEYQNRIQAIHPIDFAKQWEKFAGTFDYAISFSSIEHSGIGRYGDPLDPIGDLREVLKIRCMLKTGGLFFLGVPQGTDAILFNLHRIYGPLRFSMLITGFEVVAVYDYRQKGPIKFTWKNSFDFPLFSHIQQTVVLRKI